MKIKTVFDLNQGQQITDEEIYCDLGNIPIITGDNEIKGYWSNSIIEIDDLPCITYPTKANSGVCFVQDSIFDANNTAILIPKKEWRKKILLEWVAFKLSKIFPDVSTSKKGVSYLNKEIVDEIEIKFPLKNIQEKEYNSISKLLKLRTKIPSIVEKIKTMKVSKLIITYKKYQEKQVQIVKILNCMSGNSGLTEDFLYSQIQKDLPRQYRILTGSVDYETNQYIYKCTHPKNPSKSINVIEKKPVIHIIRKGSAGSCAFFDTGDYTINDDAYLLYLKDEYIGKIDLKWLMYNLKHEFLEYSSSSDNGTWNMTGFFKNVKVDIPNIDEQRSIVKKYEHLETLEKKITIIMKTSDELLSKEIVN